MAKQPKKKRMGFIHKIESVLASSRFPFHSVTLYLMALQLAIYLCFVSASLAGADEEQGVLILQSYHIGYPWSDNVTKGITSVLQKEKDVELFFEYMDTKRHMDKPYLEKLRQLYKDKYGSLSLDVIICSDDNALNFLLRNRDNLFPDVPIVFCGINNFTDSRIAGHTNITGVVENPDVLGTLQIALRLHPGTRQVAAVYDQTKTGLANEERLREIAPDFEKQVEIKYITDKTISELQHALRALPPETIVLHLSFAKARDGIFLSLREASKLVNSNSDGPVYTCWDVRMAYPGHCGGKMVSGYVQGKTAARMALRILHGESANNVDIIRKSPNVYMFDYAQMNRFGLSKKDLPKHSIIVNEPFSFYGKYKGWIWIILGTFAFLLMLISFLIVNIFQRKRAEKALQESEERYRTLMDNLPVGVYRNTPGSEGEFLMANPAFCKMFGFKNEEEIKESTPASLYQNLKERKEYSDNLIQKGVIKNDERTLLKRDGTPVNTSITASVVCGKDGEVSYFDSIMLDITEQKLAQEALRESEEKLARSKKMEAMGLMAGGVAHDLNNILSGIVSYPELLLMNLPEDSPLRKPIKIIQESGMRAADVVEDLMTIARGVASSKEVLNLNTMVAEYLKSAEYQKLESIQSFVNFRTELNSDLLNMSGSPTHIKKILMNLVTNASEAIEGSGTVTISTVNQYLDEPLKGYEDIRTGEYVMLTVSDDGSGISPRDLERIFEPFYTKKVMGKSGTGLGLAVVWNTVQDHNGYINVKSSEKGTAFELYFPVIREEVADGKEEVHLEDYLGHGEKILVVDDEERQREIACRMLTQLGFKAESVSSGKKAIEYLKEYSVDLIVLDMVMPKGINGRETYQEIIKIRPDQKAIIASGYAKTKEVDLAQKLGAGKYIKKPYILEEIGVAVKEEMEK